MWTIYNMSMQLTIPDAEILLYEGSSSPLMGTDYFNALLNEIPWREETITLFGKTHLQPRMLEFLGDLGIAYTYSKKLYRAVPWTETLLHLRGIAEQVAQAPFNSVLANYYRNERDSMGMHADDEPELGKQPTILSMSFGTTRTFVLRHKTRRDVPVIRIPLHSESILVMKGATQQHWLHGIEKKTRAHGPRINLTFRCIQKLTPPI
jgi:alkylated DNA repair dioxygenase AlkB